MNTKEAYAKYGRWATISGWARALRYNGGGRHTPAQAILYSDESHVRWARDIASGSEDSHYDKVAVVCMEFLSRLRRPADGEET